MSGERSGLVRALPRVIDRPPLHEDAGGFRYLDEPDETYIPPLLRQASGGAAAPSLIMVDARAAVGKSMLARHLAWATGGPLWDLSGTYVGTGTLWGSLARAFGPQQLNSVIGRTATGEFVLIIDALDEAEMHAGGEAFDAFLLELRDMFAGSRPLPGAVILGRTETMDYVELFLGTSVPISRYHISEFDRELAYQFVDCLLDRGKVAQASFTPGAHRRREKLYEEARQRLFDFLVDQLLPDREAVSAPGQDALPDWPARIGSFLGYAPVLEAIAEYLASYAANYQELLAEISFMERHPYRAGNAQWNMLRAIVERLLLREQDKVITQARKIIPDSAGIGWASLYDPSEQCARVLGRVTGRLGLDQPPAGLPDEAHARYRDLLKNAVPNHPFLGQGGGFSNVVFRDYVHAWALCTPDPAARAAVRAEIHAPDYLPSPLLGPFILSAPTDDGPPVIEGPDVGFVYESLVTHGDTELYVHAEPDENASVFVGRHHATDVAVFEVSRPDEGIQFWRRLRRARLQGDMAVQLGLPGGSFSIGPDVVIETAIIEARCRSIRVYTSENSGVLLDAVGYLGGDVEPDVVKFGPGRLTVSWDVVRHPWAQYARSPDDEPAVTRFSAEPAAQEAFALLCRVMQRFVSSNRSARALWPVDLKSAFFHRRRPNTLLDALMTWLTSQQIILARPHSYVLDAEQLRRRHIRLFDLVARKETPEVLDLVLQFLAEAEQPG